MVMRRRGVGVERARDKVDADVAAAPLVRDEEARARHALAHERTQARLRAALGQPVHDPLHIEDAVEPVVVGQPPRRRLGRARLAVHLECELREPAHDGADALDRRPVSRALGRVEVVDRPRLLRRGPLLGLGLGLGLGLTLTLTPTPTPTLTLTLTRRHACSVEGSSSPAPLKCTSWSFMKARTWVRLRVRVRVRVGVS